MVLHLLLLIVVGLNRLPLAFFVCFSITVSVSNVHVILLSACMGHFYTEMFENQRNYGITLHTCTVTVLHMLLFMLVALKTDSFWLFLVLQCLSQSLCIWILVFYHRLSYLHWPQC